MYSGYIMLNKLFNSFLHIKTVTAENIISNIRVAKIDI